MESAILERKELRAVSNYTLYDDPSRLLRVLRFKVRLGYNIEERTKMQYDNAREAQLETRIPPEALLEELRHIANEPNVADVIHILEEEKLLPLISPTLTPAKMNMPGLQKLQKAKQIVPFGIDIHLESMGLFLYFLGEKLNPKERAAFAKGIGLSKREFDQWQKLEAKSKKLEKDLKSAKLQKPSHVYSLLSKSPGEEILFFAGALFRAPGARPHPELFAEVLAERAGNYGQGCAGHRREAGHAQVPEDARRDDPDQAGCASEESAPAGSAATTAPGRPARQARGSSARKARRSSARKARRNSASEACGGDVRARDGAQVTRGV